MRQAGKLRLKGLFRGSNDETRRGFNLSALIIVLASLAQLIGALVYVTSNSWNPVDDFAIIDMRIRDVWSLATPLTGLYSRPGWNHPGPMMFWVLSPSYELSGGASNWVRIGGVVVATVFISTALFLAARLSRSMLVVTALLWLLSLLALPIDALRAYWNPWMPLPAFILLIVLVLRVAAGRTRDLIGVVVVGSFAVQTHVGTALLVAVLAIFALGFITLDALRSRSMPAGWRPTLLWTAGVATLLWLAPLVGVITRAPVNLSLVGQYFLKDSDSSIGMSSGLKIMANEFSPPIPWMGGGYTKRSL